MTHIWKLLMFREIIKLNSLCGFEFVICGFSCRILERRKQLVIISWGVIWWGTKGSFSLTVSTQSNFKLVSKRLLFVGPQSNDQRPKLNQTELPDFLSFPLFHYLLFLWFLYAIFLFSWGSAYFHFAQIQFVQNY